MKPMLIKPYGDRPDDGIVQLSFTLPVENGARARKAAVEYCKALNMEHVEVASSREIAEGFTSFVIFARAKPAIDYGKITALDVTVEEMSFEGVNSLIDKSLGRKIRVAGATIGSDAHTVGIDAIMNMKGYKQDYGLERYPGFMAHNMGAQVAGQLLLEKAIEMEADAILVSQTVTKNDIHLKQLKEFMNVVNSKNMRRDYLIVAGGARITHELALGLGYDAGFGAGTLPSQVASYLANKVIERLKLRTEAG